MIILIQRKNCNVSKEGLRNEEWQMATIKDIAKKAGVAISTVSYALNNDHRVNVNTKKRIMEVAKELNYRPNGVARDLKMKKVKTIGIFMNDFGGPFYSELIRGVQEIVYSNGYDLIACSTYGEGEESTVHRFLKEKRIDGAILLAPTIPNELVLDVASDDFPIVVLDRELKSDHIYSVLIDNKQGAFKAVNHLINLGYRKIGYLSGPNNSYDNLKRLEGLKSALEMNNLPFVPSWNVQGRFTEEGGYQAMKILLTSPNIPQAVFSANDEMAVGAIKALNEAGLKVPDDLAIIGFDDIRLASYIQPPLTTMSHHKYEWGTLATQILFYALQEKSARDTIFLPVELIKRESCGNES
jgi:LacI family transcriptional regulator